MRTVIWETDVYGAASLKKRTLSLIELKFALQLIQNPQG